MNTLTVVVAGTVGYGPALQWQNELYRRRVAGEAEDVMLLLEHPHVYTLGRRFSAEHLLLSREALAQRGIEVFECDRGGSITYHGPGQLVGYPVLELEDPDVIAYLRSLASPPFAPLTVPALVTAPGAPHQPIFFSHLIHAGKYQIACQYCHADARRSEYAGLPSVERCMGCHKIIGAQDNPEIGKIHDYWRRGQPIPWVRIFKLPEFTYFPHKAHVRAGLECGTCHGPIERMRRVGDPRGRRS